MQQNEIRRALELQILEKKRILDEERKKQLEHDKREELRIQNDIQNELQNEDNEEIEGKYKQKRPRRLDPQFMQTQFAGQMIDSTGNSSSSQGKVVHIEENNEEEYKETPSLAEVKASDINDQIQSNNE